MSSPIYGRTTLARVVRPASPPHALAMPSLMLVAAGAFGCTSANNAASASGTISVFWREEPTYVSRLM